MKTYVLVYAFILSSSSEKSSLLDSNRVIYNNYNFFQTRCMFSLQLGKCQYLSCDEEKIIDKILQELKNMILGG